MTEHPRIPRTAAEPEVICAELAWWLTSAGLGRSEGAQVADALNRYADRHEVARAGEQAVGLELHLASLSPLAGAGIALARPGDLVGLAGPPPVNRLVAESGAAVLWWSHDRTAQALVPVHLAEDRSVVRWRTMSAGLRPPPDLVAADQGLRATLIETADSLARLDVARWRPALADELISLRQAGIEAAPSGVPVLAQRLAAASWRAYRIAGLAGQDEGAVLSSSEALRRDHGVEQLKRAARRALVAAYSADAWPPPTPEAHDR